MTGHRSFTIAAAGTLSAAAIVFAQQSAPPSPQQPPVFRAGVEIVALDVTVVDRDGKPVTGLRPEDFVVTLSGQVRPVRTFDYATFGAAPPSEAAADSRETTNDISRAGTASRGGRIVILLIDDLAATPGQGKGLLVAAERMLNTLDLGDLVGLATTSGLGTVVTPTRDRAALLAALTSKGVVGRKENITAPVYVTVPEAIATDKYIPGGRMPEEVATMIGRECDVLELGDACPPVVLSAARRLYSDTIHRTASQLMAYKTIITALKAAPQPRVVIALSTGVMPNVDNTLDLKQVSRAAAEAGVQFYALVEVGDDVDAADPSGGRAKARREESEVLRSGVQVVAAAAGGEAFSVIGQADRFFKRIIAETSGVYRLGVDAPVSNKPDRFIDAKVKVNRDGVTVRSNRNALVKSAAAEPLPIDDALRTRLAQGGVAYGVPVALATAMRRERAGDRVELGVNVQVPANVSGPVIAMFNVVDGTGQTVQAGKKSIAQTAPTDDYRFALGIPLAPGAYRLRVATADAAGNIGSVETAVDATLKRLGDLAASDLFLTWSGSDTAEHFLALETLPADASVLHVALELYPRASATPPEARVRFEVGRAGTTTAEIEETASAVADGTLLKAATDLQSIRLEPGVYTIRATVSVAGRDLGTISTVVRKAR